MYGDVELFVSVVTMFYHSSHRISHNRCLTEKHIGSERRQQQRDGGGRGFRSCSCRCQRHPGVPCQRSERMGFDCCVLSLVNLCEKVNMFDAYPTLNSSCLCGWGEIFGSLERNDV